MGQAASEVSATGPLLNLDGGSSPLERPSTSSSASLESSRRLAKGRTSLEHVGASNSHSAASDSSRHQPQRTTSLLTHGAQRTWVLQACICPWTTLQDIVGCTVVCKEWHRLARQQEWLHKCVLSGYVTRGERRGLWGYLSAAGEIQHHWCCRLSELSGSQKRLNSEEAFHELLSWPLQQSKISEIERDVRRTYQTHERFAGEEGHQGRAELQQVLQAFSVAEPDIGYCQGMNFVAATLLIHTGSAHEAFWLFMTLIESYHMRYLFAPGVPLLPLRVFQFVGLVQKHLPRLWRHMREAGMALDNFAHQCVLTLFSYSLETELLAHVYDSFFLLGWKALFRIGLGVLSALEEQLLCMCSEEIPHFLHQCKRHLNLTAADSSREDRLHLAGAFKRLLRFDFQASSLDELENAFRICRLEALLAQVASSPDDIGMGHTPWDGGSEPLPPGLERSLSGNSFLVDPKSLKSGNTPTRKREGTCKLPASHCLDQNQIAIPVPALEHLKTDLLNFDAETQLDVSRFRSRILAADKELSGLLRSTANFREEAQQCETKWNEMLSYKKALMDAMHFAASSRPGSLLPAAHVELISECREKLQRLESELLEVERRRKETIRESELLREHTSELQEFKSRSMLQLQAFLEDRARSRQEMLQVNVDSLLGLSDAGCKPMDLETFLAESG
eukprot:TRINITY_DN23745_c0_g1_i1.p1 TRINITY_DN23745_c0_g1~~TRINITY_DN23745_c0_g1_i1.p1  ORF type:complete len:701 (+),score=107.12 TRINITY_DN23745_c0_g1_i1:74-2104(+)